MPSEQEAYRQEQKYTRLAQRISNLEAQIKDMVPMEILAELLQDYQRKKKDGRR